MSNYNNYVFTLARGPLGWRSTLRSIVSLSITEEEHMVVTEAFNKSIWLQDLSNDLGVVHDQISVDYDSRSAIYSAK